MKEFSVPYLTIWKYKEEERKIKRIPNAFKNMLSVFRFILKLLMLRITVTYEFKLSNLSTVDIYSRWKESLWDYFWLFRISGQMSIVTSWQESPSMVILAMGEPFQRVLSWFGREEIQPLSLSLFFSPTVIRIWKSLHYVSCSFELG